MKIEEIRDIVRLIDGYKQQDRLPFDLKELRSGDSKLSKFYKILTETKFQRDEDASYAIYGQAPKTKYKFLKSYFTSRALGSLAYLDLQGAGISERTQAVYKSYKNLSHISILIRLGRRFGAIALAKKTLPLTEKYELHHVAIEVLGQLRSHAVQTGNKKEFVKFSNLQDKNMQLLESEIKILTLENSIRINFTKTSYIDEKYEPETFRALRRIRKILKSNETFANRISYYRLLYGYRQIEGFPLKSIAACDEAIDYLKRMPHMTSAPILGEFALYKLENYLLLRNYKRGLTALSESAQYFKTGTNNWFRYKEQHILLLMNMLNFHEAYLIFQEAVSDLRYESLAGHLKERWEIFRIYMEYVMHIDAGKNLRTIVPVEAYSKDKKGFHVAVLILNILKLLEIGDRAGLIEQAETLSTYRFKYLSGKHSRQSFFLFKLIYVMINNEFDISIVRKKARRLERILAKTKPGRLEIFECVQIFPPTWMWGKMKIALELQSKERKILEK